MVDKGDVIIFVEIIIYVDCFFIFIIKIFLMSYLICKVVGIGKGSLIFNKVKVGKLNWDQVLEIVKIKMFDLNVGSVEVVVNMVVGIVCSMGVIVEGGFNV